MGRSFVSASSQYLEGPSPVSESDYPFTLTCRFKADRDTSRQSIFAVLNGSSSLNYHHIRLMGDAASDPIGAVSKGTSGEIASVIGFTKDAWHLAVAIFAGTSSRLISIDGGAFVEDTATTTPTGIDTVRIGYLVSTANLYFDGDVSDAAIWDTDLSAAEAAELYNGGLGMDPRYIRPANLLAYWPLIDSDLDVVGTYDLTPYNDPTFVTGPSLLLPSTNELDKGASATLPPPARRQFMIGF